MKNYVQQFVIATMLCSTVASNSVYSAPMASAKMADSDINGSYTAITGIEYENWIGVKDYAKEVSVTFTAEEGGNIVNRLTLEAKSKTMVFNEVSKMSKKLGAKTYRYDSYESYWLVELEPKVYMFIANSDTHREEVNGKEDVKDVFAKDAEKLKKWDLETAKAKFTGMFRSGAKAEGEKIKKRLMEDYPTYKNNIGKVVFVNDYHVFNYSYTDKPTEDDKKFVKTITLGSPLYFGAYLNETVEQACGKDCELNFEYEMNGVKTNRVELRKSAQKWGQYIRKKDTQNSQYCLNNGHQLWSPSENVMDYAFWYCLYQNKAKLKSGSSNKLKVTIYANRDGNNSEKLAEGTLILVTDASTESNIKFPMSEMTKLVEDE